MQIYSTQINKDIYCLSKFHGMIIVKIIEKNYILEKIPIVNLKSLCFRLTVFSSMRFLVGILTSSLGNVRHSTWGLLWRNFSRWRESHTLVRAVSWWRGDGWWRTLLLKSDFAHDTYRSLEILFGRQGMKPTQILMGKTYLLKFGISLQALIMYQSIIFDGFGENLTKTFVKCICKQCLFVGIS